MNRRKFIKNTTLGSVGLIAGTGFYAYGIEPFWLEIVRLPMPIANLPKGLIGKTLMQISDVHVGNRFDYQYIIDSFKKAQSLQPDFVVYTGDYVSFENKQQFDQLREVFDYVVKGQLATLGILGNHDYGHNWSEQWVADEITSILTDAGVDLLFNEKRNESGLNIIGIDDFWGLNFNPKKATNQYQAGDAHISLCHNPDVCDLDVWNGYQGWILSGHTHGGQCKPPFLDPPLLPVKNKQYSAGHIDLQDGRNLYINRALGHLRQVRFNVRPEITLFELVAEV